ncbi:MAG: 50S ribosomal protein L35 [Phycisphaerae bacterium]|jgi:large subunit ribosomal protein L35
MPKQKTHKGLKKRIKITASGKVMHKHAGGGHLMSSKNAKRRRRIAKDGALKPMEAKKIRAAIVR